MENILVENARLKAAECCDSTHQSIIYSASVLPSGNVGIGQTYTITLKLNNIPFTPIVLVAGIPFNTAIVSLNNTFKALKAVFSIASNGKIKGVITNPSDGFSITTVLA